MIFVFLYGAQGLGQNREVGTRRARSWGSTSLTYCFQGARGPWISRRGVTALVGLATRRVQRRAPACRACRHL